MSSFAEFCLIAAVLFVAESILWTPLRHVTLLVSLKRKQCRILDPRRWFTTNRTGVVFASLLPGSGAHMPCYAFPLVVDDDGQWLMQQDDGRFIWIETPEWADIFYADQQLKVGKRTVKMASVRAIEMLRKAKNRGLSPEQAVRASWRKSLSTTHAQREWRKWRLLVEPLLWAQPFLLGWFCFGLFLYVLQGEAFRYWYFLICLFAIMSGIGLRVLWMITRAYPSCRRELILDALLCFVVPFHAMRIAEFCAAKVFGAVHPFAMLLHLEPTNPWLIKQLRMIAHPRPHHSEDHVLFTAMRSQLSVAMSKAGVAWNDFTSAPTQEREQDEAKYCPRCHARFMEHVKTCRDCDDYPVSRCEVSDRP